MSIKKNNAMKGSPFIIVVVAALLNSCELIYPCLDGNGILSTESRGISDFSGIYVTTDFNVEVNYGTETSIEIQADENLLQYIETYVRNDDLLIEIDQDRCLESQNPIILTVTTPNLEKLINSGAGNVDIYDFEVSEMSITLSGSGDVGVYNVNISDELSLINSGTGDISCEGKALSGDCLLSGSGDIDADDLKFNTCDIILSGSGSVDVYVVESLEVNLSGSGNVRYQGSPDVRSRITGSGSIIQL